MVLAVPNRDGFLQLVRPETSLDHIIADYELNVTEHDMTHVEELIMANIKLHDETAKLRKRKELLQNYEHRMMHHHCFGQHLVVALVNYVGMQIRAFNRFEPYHIVCLAEKLNEGQIPNNSAFMTLD